MDQGQGFGKIGVEPQRSRHGARDLRDLQRVRKPVAKVIGITRGEDLRLRFEAAKGPRVNHAVAIARVRIAVGMQRFGVTPAARIGHIHEHRKQGPWLNSMLHRR